METCCPGCGQEFESRVSSGSEESCPRCLARFILDGDPGAMRNPGAARENPDPPPLQVGTQFRGHEIQELLGRGGMGFVYKARQEALGRTVALKVLLPRLAADPEFSRRFEREARSLATLNHPNIVHIYEFGRENDLFFLTMEFVDGVPLRDLLRQNRLASPEALKIVPQICEGLEYAHSQGVVHRDIKPENILIDRAGHVKIADFGLAKLAGSEARTSMTQTNVVMGTPHYMAPEQVETPRQVDHRADIYSLGVVFYEMLTGELPLGKFEPPSHRVQVDVRLDEVVLKALEKRPERRYQTVADVRTDVATVTSTPPSPPKSLDQGVLVEVRPFVRALAGVVAVLGALGCVGLIGMALSERNALGWIGALFAAPLVSLCARLALKGKTRVRPDSAMYRYVAPSGDATSVAHVQRPLSMGTAVRVGLMLACLLCGLLIVFGTSSHVPVRIVTGTLAAIVALLGMMWAWVVLSTKRTADPMHCATPNQHSTPLPAQSVAEEEVQAGWMRFFKWANWCTILCLMGGLVTFSSAHEGNSRTLLPWCFGFSVSAFVNGALSLWAMSKINRRWHMLTWGVRAISLLLSAILMLAAWTATN